MKKFVLILVVLFLMGCAGYVHRHYDVERDCKTMIFCSGMPRDCWCSEISTEDWNKEWAD